jgi:hypothetical protein
MVFFEGYTDGIERVIFFYATVLLVIIFFYYQRIYRRTKNYLWKIHRRSIFVSDFVGKLITESYTDRKIPSIKLLKRVVGETCMLHKENQCQSQMMPWWEKQKKETGRRRESWNFLKAHEHTRKWCKKNEWG